MKKTKYALLHSVIALLLCVSMLVGTTFAWFTDSVSSAKNQIIAGNLDIELAYSKDMGSWSSVAGKSDIVDPNALWEPGHTEVVYLKISNEGNLALKYSFNISFKDTVVGKSVLGNDIYLSQHLKYAVVDVDAKFADRDAARNAVKGVAVDLAGYSVTGTMAKDAKEKVVALVIFMPESVGNEANYRGDAIPRIDMGITLIATQLQGELDSFGPDYDAGAQYPAPQINFSASQTVAADAVENGALKQEMTVGNTNDEAYAEVPSGVKLAEGAESLTLTVKTMENSEANVTLEGSEVMTSLDVHMEGVAADNDVAMQIVLDNYLPKGLNSTSIALYHVENGNTVAMTAVAKAELDAHNEFYYDPATGTVILSLKSFSEVAVVADTDNPWDGTESEYAMENGEVVIYNAQQLAYFRSQVDAGNSFEDMTVKLGADINLNGKLFDPIGWGYANSAHNNNQSGKVFKGVFDGGKHTIYGLYQNGWDLESSTGTDYTYTNCGMGLFASVCDATIKNLTISGAEIVAECVEMGILVGLSQGDCNYENINIYNSKIANYQRATGGLIGEVSGAGITNIVDVNIGSAVVVGSLWGDFDCPVGGVIGARWDDVAANPQIVMENVEVACRLDVYSDVTSSYQWYAYRRAGMLIGNTDTPPADGKNSKTATADFLTCVENEDGSNTVKVIYGAWVHYTYCEFSQCNGSWPWVRVQEGENCSAYSNPRWGVATRANGDPITNEYHEERHNEGEGHGVEITFDQLYGGGQGVYGAQNHKNSTSVDDDYDVDISYAKYSITFVNNGKVLDVVYVTEEMATSGITVDNYDYKAATLAKADMDNEYEVDHWINAGSTEITYIPSDNTDNYVLYPSFAGLYTAIFVDQDGNILDWTTFTVNEKDKITELGKSLEENDKIPETEELTFDYWEVHVTDADGNTETQKALADYSLEEKNITLYPIYTYDGDVNLIPIDNDGDGITDEYHVGGYNDPNGQELVEIPDKVNGKEITAINANAFAAYDGVHAIVIPTTVTNIGATAVAEEWGYLDDGETVTIYYEGSYADWLAKEAKFDPAWDNGISGNSRIFFLNGTGKVDPTQGYLQASKENASEWYNPDYYISWTHNTELTAELVEEYTGYCDCDVSTTGDTAHVYVDANGNVMGRNEEGTPVNSSGTVIEYKRENFRDDYKLTTDFTDTYYRFRPDVAYWEGVTVG